MRVYDSNFWIAFFDIDDSQHAKTKPIFEREDNFSITEYCVSETATILSRKRSKEAAITFLKFIGDNANITIIYSTPSYFGATMELFKVSKEKRLSFVDASLLFLSESHEVITFDKALARAIASSKKK